MGALSTALDTALANSAFTVFHAVQISLSNSNTVVNLLDGSGTVSFPISNVTTTFSGFDAVYGSLSSVSTIPESVSTQAPSIQIVLMPPSTTGIAYLSDPLNQSSSVKIFFGALNPATGAVIDVIQIFSGKIDFVKTTSDMYQRSVELEVVSEQDRFFITNEANRLNDVYHQSIWPGETGMLYNVQSSMDPYWGVDTPAPPANQANWIPESTADILSGLYGPGYVASANKMINFLKG